MRTGPTGRARWTWVLRLYPTAWDRRYGDEMRALLTDRPPTWRDAIDLARAALDAHLHPPRPSRLPANAALIAGAAWGVVALAILLEPAPPDWPGFVFWVLPVAVIAAASGLVATLALSMRLGDRVDRVTRVVRAVVAIASIGWVVALAVAASGGPYGWVTGAAASIAAVATVMLGLSLLRSGATTPGVALVLVGVALLIPPPAAWVAVAASWTAVGIWLHVERQLRIHETPRGAATP